MSEKKPSLFTLNRNHVLTSLSGRSVEFVKGVPTHVPPMMIKEALAIGANPAEGTEADLSEPEVKKAPTDPDVRSAAIMEAVEKLAAQNDREAFTAAGSPTAKAVSALVGYTVAAQEVKKVWGDYQAALAEGREQSKLDDKHGE